MTASARQSTRLRLVALAIVAVLLLGASAAYLLVSRSEQQHVTQNAPGQSTVQLASVSTGPRIVFRNTAIGPNYGRVAMVRLGSPAGARAFTGSLCDRVFAASDRMLCLASDPGVVTAYTARTWQTSGGPARDLPLTGIPSRARLSADGRLAATTSFVAGDSYASTSFSTRTVVSELDKGVNLDLEKFRLVHRGKVIAPSDRNYWGVTFAGDDDGFFVTVMFHGTTWLGKGSLSSRTVRTLRSDAECPSLSPDGSKVAYKKRGNRRAGDWRLAVLDLATGKETQLTETHSVDDQVEWLDEGHILYGLPGQGTKVAETDVWALPVDGRGQPRLLIQKAWSPAVVR
ncbi:TolB family protein [Pedococcus sp. 5OH_020]|uniref:TolB family protein n=1 Tax=Pedococcus sp. 5OH_020 TaxID=2989814 RepID=UPI0022EA01BF|nr:hypothetical protein [Pedococcus sp. 5OH_020]